MITITELQKLGATFENIAIERNFTILKMSRSKMSTTVDLSINSKFYGLYKCNIGSIEHEKEYTKVRLSINDEDVKDFLYIYH